MDLKNQQSHPKDEQPDSLEKAVESRAWWELYFYWWYLPYNALTRWLERRYDAKNPPWDDSHYADWSIQDLRWRITFLQGAGRSLWVEREFWRRFAIPVLLFVALVAGLLIGRSVRPL